MELWGLMFGVILLVEKLLIGKYLEKMPDIIKRIYVLFIVMISFIIFNANNIGEAFNNIKGLFGINGEVFINNYSLYYLRSYAVIIIIAIIGATPIIKKIIEKLKRNKVMNRIINIIEPIAMIVLLVICTAYSIDNSYNPFLYFRF